MKAIVIVTAIVTAIVTWSSWAEAVRKPTVWTPTAGQYETAVYRAFLYYCEDAAGNHVRAIVDSANAPTLTDPNAIYVHKTVGSAHVRSNQFIENRVIPECSDFLGSKARVVGGPIEIVPDWRRD